MKRPLVGMAVALVLGEVIANTGNSSLVVIWILLSVCCVIIYMIDREKYKMMMVMPACMGIGIILALQASKIPILDSYVKDEPVTCQVIGSVYWKEYTGEKWKIYTKDNEVTIKDTYSCRRLLLYSETEISIGSTIQVEGEITQFAIATNKGQFDARQYYRAKNIDYTVYVSKCSVLKETKNSIREQLIQIRHSLLQSLEEICIEDEFGIFQAVFLGEKTSIDTEIKSLYQANGISHILAISGLHISFIGSILYKLLKKITGSYTISMIGGVFFLLAYGWMTGFAVSALRAVIMFICMMGAQCVGRSYDMLSSAGLSAILVLLEYPLQIYEAGFLLTYGAIIGIAGVMPHLEEENMSKSILCSFSVQLVTLPVILWFYYTYPIYSIILNLFVIPFAGYLLFSAMAGSVVGLWWQLGGKFFIGSGHFVLRYYNQLCYLVEKLPFATDVVGRPALWQIIVYYVILVIFLIFTKKNKGIWVFSSILMYLLLHPIPDNYLHITILDVDQGDCIHVQMPDGEHVLIDGGSTGVKNVGKYRMIPYLLSQGVDTLERIVVTHPDEDHMNGILELLQDGRIQVKQLYIPDMEEGFYELFKLAEDIQIVYAKAGDKFDEYWSCKYPYEDMISADANANSVILQLQYGAFLALFTGDAGIEEEKLLQLETVTLLKVGHHGSKYSSGKEFLAKIKPKIAIISCGKNNFYGHPHKEVITRLEEIGTQILTTSKIGAVHIKTDGTRYWLER